MVCNAARVLTGRSSSDSEVGILRQALMGVWSQARGYDRPTLSLALSVFLFEAEKNTCINFSLVLLSKQNVRSTCT